MAMELLVVNPHNLMEVQIMSRALGETPTRGRSRNLIQIPVWRSDGNEREMYIKYPDFGSILR